MFSTGRFSFSGLTDAVSGGFRAQSRLLRALMALLVSCSLVLAGCTIGNSNAEEEAAEQAKIEKVREEETPKLNVGDEATDVNPTEPIEVTVEHTTLTSVTMTNEAGKVVEAEISDNGKKWHVTEPLGYYRTYTVDAQAANGQSLEASFTTVAPDGRAAVYLGPLDGSVVGVGQTISFRFNAPIADRQAAQDAITVSTTPEVEGAFYWLNNSEMRWRPAEFWPSGTEVEVRADIYGVDLGNGMYGNADNEISFSIGDEIISTVDDSTKTMTVTKNGEVLKTMPVSLGDADFPTPNGTYMIGDQNPSMIMDSSTFGLAVDSPRGYRQKVDWATQMSWSGIYVHSAPWSMWAQGSTNTSHGCVNVSPENAKWFQELVKRGDVVKVKNTIGGELSGFDGLGDWNIPWETWKKGNADQTSSW
ncbi:Ig-like domain-containing protein [Corynebacterium sp. TAE3-ERU30]|uniref:L,D-transpeptidase n=1 Tax=Corynebacterium sp. TAE3-ERU30 TaxID=2849496 RepID=UPI001C476914|nr:L,D-transpeptidase family protein [Corynebacterium sp. TAE3-ERU30]